MHAGQLGRGNHGGIRGLGVEPGDGIAHRARQHLERLWQIADPAAQPHRIPLIQGRAIQPDFARIGPPRADQQARQCGFAAGRIADHPQPVTGVQRKAYIRQNPGRVDAGPGGPEFGQPGDADRAGRVRQGNPVRRRRSCGKHCL